MNSIAKLAIGATAAVLPFQMAPQCAAPPDPKPPVPQCQTNLADGGRQAYGYCAANSVPQCQEYTVEAKGSNGKIYRGNKWADDGAVITIYAPGTVKFAKPKMLFRPEAGCA